MHKQYILGYYSTQKGTTSTLQYLLYGSFSKLGSLLESFSIWVRHDLLDLKQDPEDERTLVARSQTLALEAETLPQKAQDTLLGALGWNLEP